jgi:hypothetical protein
MLSRIQIQLTFSLLCVASFCSCGFKEAYDQVTNPQTTADNTLYLEYPDGGVANVGSLTSGSSRSYLLSIRVVGSGEATVTSTTLSTGTSFNLGTHGSCTTNITSTCSIELTFAPSTIGMATDLLTIDYTVNGNTQSLSFMLQGTGI